MMRRYLLGDSEALAHGALQVAAAAGRWAAGQGAGQLGSWAGCGQVLVGDALPAVH